MMCKARRGESNKGERNALGEKENTEEHISKKMTKLVVLQAEAVAPL